MTKCRVVAVLSLVFVALVSLPAMAQSCEPEGTPVCGNCVGFNMIADGYFYETTCGAWSFDSAASRGQYSMSCGATDTYRVKITGNTSGWQGISQYVMADQGGDRFSFKYSVEIDDPDTTVEVWVGKYPSVWTQVDSISNTTGCVVRTINDLDDNGWDNEPLLVLIRADIPDSGKTVIIDSVSFWQYP